MTRRGFTLMEALIAAAIGSLVLGAMVSMFYASRKMTDVGDLASALAEASIAMEHIHRDLTQAVQKPDPAITEPILISKEGAAQFVHAVKGENGKLEGKLVVYRREKLATGNYRLMRKFGDAESPLPGVYSRIGLAYYKRGGGPFVRVTLHVVARDRKVDAPGGADEAVLTSLVHVDAPEMLESPFFDWSCLDGLKSVEMLKGAGGF